MAKKTRLDKFLCDSLNMTRKEAKESVKKGKVVVNGGSGAGGGKKLRTGGIA